MNSPCTKYKTTLLNCQSFRQQKSETSTKEDAKNRNSRDFKKIGKTKQLGKSATFVVCFHSAIMHQLVVPTANIQV